MVVVGSLLVGADTGGFEGFGTQLFIFVGDHVDAEREVIHVGLLTSKIEDSDLRVWDTTVETGLGVWLDISKLASYPSSQRVFVSVQKNAATVASRMRHPPFCISGNSESRRISTRYPDTPLFLPSAIRGSA